MNLATTTGPAVDARAKVLSDFARAIESRFGLAADAWRPAVLERRLAAAMKACGANPAEARSFVRALERAGTASPECRAAADALTNQETFFFREAAQLEALVSVAVPEVLASAGRGAVRLLSVGCATGEEAYSLAMLLLENVHLLWGRRFQVVGVDLSRRALEVARTASYPSTVLSRAGRGPEGWATRHFRREGKHLCGRRLLRDVCEFSWANLAAPDSLDALGQFDIVLCRNVLIYFGSAGMAKASASLAALVRPGGVLVLGDAESGSFESRELLPRSEGGLRRWVRTADSGTGGVE